jgi:hypothetical protein
LSPSSKVKNKKARTVAIIQKLKRKTITPLIRSLRAPGEYCAKIRLIFWSVRMQLIPTAWQKNQQLWNF